MEMKRPKLTMKQSLSVLKGMLEFSTRKDITLLTLGLCCAAINGTAGPMSAIISGKVVNIILDIIAKRNVTSNNLSIVLNGSLVNETHNQQISYDLSALVEDSIQMDLSRNAIYYLIVGVLSLTSAFTEIYCWEVTCEKIIVRMRKKFLSQVLRQDLQWFDAAHTGHLSTQLTDDVERVRDGLGSKVALIVQLIVMILCGFAVGLYQNWRFALFLSVATPIVLFNAIVASSVTAQSAVVEQIKYGEAGAIATEVLTAITTVASFGGEKLAKARYDQSLDEGRKLTSNKYYRLAIAVSINYALVIIMYSLGLLYASYLYLWAMIDVGQMTTVFSCLIQAAFTAALCLPMIMDIGTALGAAASVMPVVERIPPIDPYSEQGKMLESVKGEITFENVNFAYPTRPAMLVLRDMNVSIPAGQIIALIGPSGAGKSTIVNLLLQFYHVTSGQILLDGVNVKDLSVKWLRKQVAIVSQEPVLFRASIAENIRYGREDATMADIIAAAKQANAHNFITSLPQGYETEVGEKGSQMSGGQRQRIAIARALVKHPKILILDEATSALDSHTEAVVQQALDNAMRARTTIIIAHRLSTVRNAHLICAMKDGKVEEVGTHESLMDKQGLYYDLVRLQTQTQQQQSPILNEEDEDEAVRVSLSRGASVRTTKSSISSTTPQTPKERSVYKALLSVKGTPWLTYAIGVVCFLMCGFAEPSLAYIYTQAVQTFLIKEKEVFKEEMRKWVCLLGSLGLCTALLLLSGLLLCCTSGEKLVQILRVEMFKKMLSQQISWFDDERNGPNRVTNLLAREPPLIKGILGGKFGILIKGGLNISLAIMISYFCNWILAFMILLVFSVVLFSSWKSLRLQVRSFQKESNIVQIGFKLATECIQNIKTVQQIGLQQLLIGRYEEMVDEAAKLAMTQALFYAVAYTLSIALIIFLNAGLCLFGNILLNSDKISPNNLMMLLFVASFTFPVIPSFTVFLNEFAKAKDPIKKICTILELKNKKFDTFAEDGLKPEIKGKIEFKNVKFAYPTRQDDPILRGLSMTVEPGQTVALVGHSGCGKSTTISLLERFYSANSGSIIIDGHNIKDIHVGFLRSNIGLVTQEPTLFNCSIKKNIGYGILGREATDAEIIDAAKKANIHDFITTLPKGYDTGVGDKGAQMSGGQKQRIAIARALIRDPKILLLDEATSALDNHSEKIVQEALERAQKGRSCIVIAHRLSTVQNADKILVISNGRVVEEGSHRELVGAQGLYFEMVQRQQHCLPSQP